MYIENVVLYHKLAWYFFYVVKLKIGFNEMAI